MISVVVPVYNCAAYLENGIQSLINQTIFEDLEIIIVNDGSSDESASMIQAYVDKYPNIKLINQENKGVSAARNRGINEASGEYITFFDADDIAENRLYEELYRLMKDYDADLSCVNYTKCFLDGVKKVQKSKVKATYHSDEILESFFATSLLCNNTIDKLFKLSIVGDLRFPEGYAIGEDMYFVFMYLLRCQKISVNTTKSLYQYFIRNDSAMKSKFSENYFDSVELAKKMMEFLSKDSYNYLLAEANWIHEMCKTLALYYQNDMTQSYDQIDDYRKQIKKYSLIKAHKYLSRKHFIALMLMRLSPSLYVTIYKMLHIG